MVTIPIVSVLLIKPAFGEARQASVGLSVNAWLPANHPARFVVDGIIKRAMGWRQMSMRRLDRRRASGVFVVAW
jgi:uncharacterized membrane protein